MRKRDSQRLKDVVAPTAAARLLRFRREVERMLPGHVTGVVLFGSRARQDARRESDYDVAVFTEDLTERRSIGHALSDLAYSHIVAGVHIRPLALPEAYRGEPKAGSLAGSISRDGISIVS